MPIQKFNRIESDDYRIDPDMLIVKKTVIQGGTSGAAVCEKHNVSMTIIETLNDDMVGLGGKKPVACFRYRISAVQLTPDEIEAKEKADKARKEAQAKQDADEAKASAASAPPPPASTKGTPPPPLGVTVNPVIPPVVPPKK